MGWAWKAKREAANRGTGGTSSDFEENIAWAMYRIMRLFKSYRLEDLLKDEFLTPQFFELCKMIQHEDKENEKERKKTGKKGKRKK